MWSLLTRASVQDGCFSSSLDFQETALDQQPHPKKPLLNYVNPVIGKVLQNCFSSHELDSFLRLSKYQHFFLHQYFNLRMFPKYTYLGSYFLNTHLSSQIPWIGAGDVNSFFEFGVVGEESQAIAVLPRTMLAVLPRTMLSAAEDPHQLSTTQQHSRNVPLRSLSFLYSGIS